MRKTCFLAAVIVGMATFFIAAGIYAGTTAPDEISMNNPAYAKHKKGIVTFSHKKHAEEYKVACGECHHDANGKPLALKAGDAVQGCIECHKLPGEIPSKLKKEFQAKKVSKKDQKVKKLEYHAEAIHYNCRDCHRDFNKKNNSKAAPTACAKCHPKTEK